MIKLLLDEHISPAVAKGIRRRNPGLMVKTVAEFGNGAFLGPNDSICLKAAATQTLTLVTYDLRTITPLLKAWIEEGSHHAGVVFVDDKTIAQANIGGLVRALLKLVELSGDLDWTDRVAFLHR